MLHKGYNNNNGLANHHLCGFFPDRKDFDLKIHLKGKYLNLGCGDEFKDGFINCDKERINGVNFLLDLDSPLPFKNDSVDGISLIGVMAHIKHPRKLMKEVDRILRPKGEALVESCLCSCHHKYNPSALYTKIKYYYL